jgi:mono/diheme cytochrome c family protein
MNCKIGSFFSLLIFFLVSMPRILKAQGSREGNHCAVVRSPYRLALDSGKIVYSRECLSCHQANGMGILKINPPLNGKFVSGDKKKLIQILITEHASAGEIKSDGSQYQVPQNPEMSDSEIANVLTYIRNSFGNKASTVKISEVKSLRSQ